MESRTLRYFSQVARAGSFSQAALDLSVAQSALSRQVRKLEDEVGAELLVRGSNGVELTDAGRRLLARATPILKAMTEALKEARTIGSGVSGDVVIGVSPATCEVVPQLIARACRRDHPGIRLQFVEGFSDFIFRQLLSQELELCLLHNPPRHRGVRAEPLLEEAMYLVGPPAGYEMMPPVGAEMLLEDLPLILPNPRHALRVLITGALGDRAERLEVIVQADGLVTTRALVGAGLGYTILPFGAIHAQLAAGHLSAVPLPGLSVPWWVTLAHLHSPQLGRAARVVATVIRTELTRLVREETWGRRPDA